MVVSARKREKKKKLVTMVVKEQGRGAALENELGTRNFNEAIFQLTTEKTLGEFCQRE